MGPATSKIKVLRKIIHLEYSFCAFTNIGPEQGTCDCGKCKCKSGWKGSDCNCRDTNETCMASNGV